MSKKAEVYLAMIIVSFVYLLFFLIGALVSYFAVSYIVASILFIFCGFVCMFSIRGLVREEERVLFPEDNLNE